MSGGHSVYCALRHGRHLSSGVDDGINVALLPYGGLHCVLFIAYAFGRVVAFCVRSSDFNTGVVPLHIFASMADLLVSGASCQDR